MGQKGDQASPGSNHPPAKLSVQLVQLKKKSCQVILKTQSRFWGLLRNILLQELQHPGKFVFFLLFEREYY